MRQLITIQRILKIEDIEGKDKIGFASFHNLGYRCIVDKTEMHAGDLVVYAEPDTLLPPKPEFEFLRKRCWNDKWGGFRITAMKLSHHISEGICFPLSVLESLTKGHLISEGNDIFLEY